MSSRPPPAQLSPAARAVIVASARSGSGWLLALLNAHPRIALHGELFNLEHAPRQAVFDPRGYLDAVLPRDRTPRVAGFKLLYHHGRLAYLNDFLREMDGGRPAAVDWRRELPARPVTRAMLPPRAALWPALRRGGATHIIHLRRHDLLRQALSHARLMADSRARWRGEPARRQAAVALDARHLVQRFERHTRTAERIAAFFRAGPRLDLWYEALLADPAGECARAYAFLGVAPPRVAIAAPPAAPRLGDLRQEIANYDAVARALAGTRWTALLEAAV
jgi:LPS sulfotransferase NodH